MSEGQAAQKSGGEDLSPVLGLGLTGFGAVGFWWWQLGERARMELLRGIARASGYGPVPDDMVAQIEWLLMHRMNDFHGMVLLLLLTATAGMLEGSARRASEVLSGFGLRRLKVGRGMLLAWLLMVVLSIAAPVALPYGVVGVALALLLFGAMYNIARGWRRVH